MSLAKSSLIAFIPSSDLARSVLFFRETLGLELIRDDGFAAVFQSDDRMLRVVRAPDGFAPQPFTILGWEVADIEAAIRELVGKGVTFATFPGMGQNELGVWMAPGGDQVAWFRDPDGNVLSLSQHAQ